MWDGMKPSFPCELPTSLLGLLVPWNQVWKIGSFGRNIDEKSVIGGGRNDFGHRSREKSAKCRRITGKFRFWSKILTKNGAWGDACGEGRSKKKTEKSAIFFGFIADFFKKTNESFFLNNIYLSFLFFNYLFLIYLLF